MNPAFARADLQGGTVKFSRSWAMPTSDTFDCQPIGDFVRRHLSGVSVDPFARNSGLATYTNDLNPATQAADHMDAEEFLGMLAKRGLRADCILLDPPYSPRQISECYAAAGLKAGMKDTQNAALYARVRRAARTGSQLRLEQRRHGRRLPPPGAAAGGSRRRAQRHDLLGRGVHPGRTPR